MNITFTCPRCGSHNLHQISKAIHRAEVKIVTTPSGELVPHSTGIVEELQGDVLGYRCSQCRYPDIRNHDKNGGFNWPTPDDIRNAGCLDIPQETPTAPLGDSTHPNTLSSHTSHTS